MARIMLSKHKFFNVTNKANWTIYPDMNVLVTGDASGQLHWELLRTAPESVNVNAAQPFLDITDAEAVLTCIRTLRPDVIINAAAYTAVDKAETDQDQAYAVNADGVRNLAVAASEVNSHLLQVSTDFVFGRGNGSPFLTNAEFDPVNVYGKSKLAGEKALLENLPNTSLIVRTAWVYSSNGNNFVKSMLRLLNERDELGVVADQIGSPTWARSLAEMLWCAARLRSTGIMHWTGAGVASWYDFAQAILEEGQALGLIKEGPKVTPLRTDQYPTPAKRPSYSALELTSTWERLEMRSAHWREDLRKMLKELA